MFLAVMLMKFGVDQPAEYPSLPLLSEICTHASLPLLLPTTHMLLTLESEMEDWISKIYVVTVEGFGSFA